MVGVIIYRCIAPLTAKCIRAGKKLQDTFYCAAARSPIDRVCSSGPYRAVEWRDLLTKCRQVHWKRLIKRPKNNAQQWAPLKQPKMRRYSNNSVHNRLLRKRQFDVVDRMQARRAFARSRRILSPTSTPKDTGHIIRKFEITNHVDKKISHFIHGYKREEKTLLANQYSLSA